MTDAGKIADLLRRLATTRGNVVVIVQRSDGAGQYRGGLGLIAAADYVVDLTGDEPRMLKAREPIVAAPPPADNVPPVGDEGGEP